MHYRDLFIIEQVTELLKDNIIITKRQYNTVSGFKWGNSEEAF